MNPFPFPTTAGKALRMHGIRGSQIGDCVAALSVLAWVRQTFPDCYTIWQVARKHAHAVPLFYNHPLIDQLCISDGEEGYGPRDHQLAASCHIRFPLMPEHRPGEVWPNLRSFYAETFTMTGLQQRLYDEMDPAARRPQLARWFKVEPQPRTIGYWPCAAYGVTQVITENGQRVVKSRNASYPWAAALVERLKAEGYRVIQFGHPNDYAGDIPARKLGADADMRSLSFMEQIQLSVSCAAVIGTDSGAGIALGAYGIPQVSLLTNHYPGHQCNLTAFQPDNPRNVSLVGVGSADHIEHDEVVAAVKRVTS